MSGVTFKVQRTTNRLSGVMKAFKDYKVEAGIFEDAGKHLNSEDGESVAQIAHKNEYGTPGIPERPFLRTSFFDNRKKYQKMIRDIAQDGLQGGRITANTFEPLGRVARLDIERSIVSGNWEDNAESTQINKGGGEQLINSPLIDSGQMLDSVEYKVSRR